MVEAARKYNRILQVGRHGGGWQVVTSGGKVVEQMYGRFPDEPHQQNFIESVKSRKRPNADIETLHPSCSMLHLAKQRTPRRKFNTEI